MKTRFLLTVLLTLLVGACAGMSRSCSASWAENVGGDWVVVQYRMDGTAFNCWRLTDVAIVNESGSDGIYWKDSVMPHLVHISGWYNRVQVKNRAWDEAARLVGVDAKQCGNGIYPAK